MAENPLVKKLQIKAGQKMAVIGPPPGYLDRLGPLPEGAGVVELPAGPLDFVQVFVKTKQELEKLAPEARACTKPPARGRIVSPLAVGVVYALHATVSCPEAFSFSKFWLKT